MIDMATLIAAVITSLVVACIFATSAYHRTRVRLRELDIDITSDDLADPRDALDGPDEQGLYNPGESLHGSDPPTSGAQGKEL